MHLHLKLDIPVSIDALFIEQLGPYIHVLRSIQTSMKNDLNNPISLDTIIF